MDIEQKVHKLIGALEPFARMDREGRNIIGFEALACQRGIASDLTVLTSGDFRRAAEVLKEVRK